MVTNAQCEPGIIGKTDSVRTKSYAWNDQIWQYSPQHSSMHINMWQHLKGHPQNVVVSAREG